jgi:hypothetical protein
MLNEEEKKELEALLVFAKTYGSMRMTDRQFERYIELLHKELDK